MNRLNSQHHNNVIISVPLNQTNAQINTTQWHHCNGNSTLNIKENFETNNSNINSQNIGIIQPTMSTSLQFNNLQFSASLPDQQPSKMYVTATQNNINNNNHLFPQNTESSLLPTGFQNSISATARILPKPNLEQQNNFNSVSQYSYNQQQQYVQPVNTVLQPSVNESTLNVSVQSTGDNKGKQERIYPCPTCSKQFKRGDHLKRHLLTVHDHEHPYKCGECSKGFVSVSSLLSHVEASHNALNVTGHLCVRCDLSFMNNKIFENHSKSLHELEDADYMRKINKSSRTFSCEICHKTVSSEKNLKRHIKKLHGEKGDNKLMCVKCDQVFTSSLNVQEHMKQVHPDDKLVTQNISNLSQVIKTEAMQSRPEIQHPTISTAHEQIVLHKPEQLVISSHSYVPYSLPHNTNYINTNVTKNQMLYQQQQIVNPPQQLIMPQQSISEEVKLPDPEWLNHAAINTSNSVPQLNICQQQVVLNSGPKHCEEINKNMNPVMDYPHSIDLGVTNTTDTVSEAFSMAMKTLSDFSYYDLSINTQDYLQGVPAVFQPNAPLPIFHNPNPAPLGSTPVPLDVAGIPQTIEESMIYPPQPVQPFSDNTKTVIPESTPQKKTQVAPPVVNITPHPPQTERIESSPMIQARRGRPKKRKRREEGAEDEDDLYGSQSMIVKEGEDEESQKFNCTVCNQVFMGIDNLMQHVESVHLSVNPHECCICNKRFAQAGNVKRHIRFVHLRERPFRCRECDSTFDRLCYLQRHMRSHIDTKVTNSDTSHLNPCNCPECGKRCLTAHHLRGHMQRKHFAKNKKKSGEFMQKYSHLFVETEPILGAKELDHFGRPIKPATKPNYSNKKHLHTNEVVNKHPIETYQQTQSQPGIGNRQQAVINNEHNKGNYWNQVMQNDAAPQNIYPNNNTANPAFSNPVMTQPTPQFTQYNATNNSLNSVPKQPVLVKQNPEKFTNRSHLKVGKEMKKIFKAKMMPQKPKKKSMFPFKCQHCPNRNFSRLSLLKSHIVVKHHSTTNRHVCIKCGRNYSSRNLLMVHFYKHHKAPKIGKNLRHQNIKTNNIPDAQVIKECNGQFSQVHGRLTTFRNPKTEESYPIQGYSDHMLPHSQSIVQS